MEEIPNKTLLEQPLLTGKLVQLKAVNAITMAENDSRWTQDSEYWRLLTTDTQRPFSAKKVQEFIEKELTSEKPDLYFFSIHTLEGDRMIGGISLDGIQWSHGDCFVGIGLGDRDYWGKGYGTDAMRVILRFAFTELNLHRVSLDVFEYNPRAIKSYEKAGFRLEGRVHQAIRRDGQRWDILFMGILREEWEQTQS